MSAPSNAPIVKGWCPGALRPMMSGDGLVVRIRAPFGCLSQDQAKGVADLSDRYGSGQMDLSARANLQLRGVSEANHPDLLTGLRELNLLDPSQEVEARRNIVMTPFWEIGDETFRIATRLNDALQAETAPQTPGKFGYAVDCSNAPVLGDCSADIRIERSEDGQLICRPDGHAFGALVTENTAAQTALELAQWFLDTGGAPGNRGRMRAHLAKGTELPDKFSEVSAPLGAAHPCPGMSEKGVFFGLEFGALTSDTLRALATLGPLRLTPWRMILVTSCTKPAAIPGTYLDPESPLLRAFACTGAPHCPQALGPTRPVARSLVSMLEPGQNLHVSGCAKGCALPGKADLTLCATGPDRFDLIRNGRANDTAAMENLSASALPKYLS